MLAARHVNFSFKVLAARKTYLITARVRKNKRTARMLASARKDHSIPLHVFSFIGLFFCQWFYLSTIHNYGTDQSLPTPLEPLPIGRHLP